MPKTSGAFRMLPKYKPSGNWGVLTTVCYVLLTVLLCGAAFVYQLGIERVTHGKLRGVLVLGFAGAAALAGYVTARVGKCRSPSLAVFAACAGGAAAVLYSHYLAYGHFVAAKNLPAASLGISDYIAERVRTGFRVSRKGGARLDGAWVYAMWAIEACAVLGAAAIAAGHCATTPFCEACGRWADEVKRSFRLPRPDGAGYETIKHPTSVLDLLDIQPGATTGLKYRLIYYLHGCPTCEDLPTLQVDLETVKKKGKKEETESSTVHRYVPLAPEEAAIIEELADEAEQPEANTPRPEPAATMDRPKESGFGRT